MASDYRSRDFLIVWIVFSTHHRSVILYEEASCVAEDLNQRVIVQCGILIIAITARRAIRQKMVAVTILGGGIAVRTNLETADSQLEI